MPRIKEISVSDLRRMLRKQDHFELLDIRTPAEIERGVLPNAKTLAMHLVPLNLNYFSESPRQIVIYCRTGSRSAQVCRFLNQQGINNVISLRGGVVKWASGGHPLTPQPSGKIE
ncbi:MAG: rhodanese-like domain-containing protein [Gammaproteobacteria bacterium]|nr:MAG: rhodanese-like domain-containing protein [Gammaproteobacteria bacterium]UCH39105.1 MAG: rhodanese-like domain-containing protein [Gammaproteobacteria bacterium]